MLVALDDHRPVEIGEGQEKRMFIALLRLRICAGRGGAANCSEGKSIRSQFPVDEENVGGGEVVPVGVKRLQRNDRPFDIDSLLDDERQRNEE